MPASARPPESWYGAPTMTLPVQPDTAIPNPSPGAPSLGSTLASSSHVPFVFLKMYAAPAVVPSPGAPTTSCDACWKSIPYTETLVPNAWFEEASGAVTITPLVAINGSTVIGNEA